MPNIAEPARIAAEAGVCLDSARASDSPRRRRTCAADRAGAVPGLCHAWRARCFPTRCGRRRCSRRAGIAAGAFVHPSARLESGVTVDPGAVIGPGAEIGAGTVIGAGAVIGPEVRIGRDCADRRACLDRSMRLIGDRVIVHPGCRIGQDGFGYLMSAGGHTKVPQIGRVIIQDDVEIGAGTTIDRGAMRDTVIGEGTKIDNLVQIGHNVTDRPPLHASWRRPVFPAA